MIRYYKMTKRNKDSWVGAVRVFKNGRYFYETRTWQHSDTRKEAMKNCDELLIRLKELDEKGERECITQ